MPDDLDREPIKARLAEASKEQEGRLFGLRLVDEDGVPVHAPAVAALMAMAPSDIADLLAEVERLRTERDHWREAAQHLSRERGKEGPP